MTSILLISLAIVAIAVLLLTIGMWIKKGGSFPNTHIEGNKHMKKRGIRCANSLMNEDATRKNLFDLEEEANK